MPNLDLGGRGGGAAGRGSARKGLAKCLTLTERRLSFAFIEGTPRPEGQALRRPWGGPIEAALILRLLLIKEKEQKCSSVPIAQGIADVPPR